MSERTPYDAIAATEKPTCERDDCWHTGKCQGFCQPLSPLAADMAPTIERIILRRLHEKRVDGFTLEMSQEIARVIAEGIQS